MSRCTTEQILIELHQVDVRALRLRDISFSGIGLVTRHGTRVSCNEIALRQTDAERDGCPIVRRREVATPWVDLGRGGNRSGQFGRADIGILIDD